MTACSGSLQDASYRYEPAGKAWEEETCGNCLQCKKETVDSWAKRVTTTTGSGRRRCMASARGPGGRAHALARLHQAPRPSTPAGRSPARRCTRLPSAYGRRHRTPRGLLRALTSPARQSNRLLSSPSPQPRCQTCRPVASIGRQAKLGPHARRRPELAGKRKIKNHGNKLKRWPVDAHDATSRGL